jgi:hypothetical protein
VALEWITVKNHQAFTDWTLFSDSVHAINDAFRNSGTVLTTVTRDELRIKALRALEVNPEPSPLELAAELGVYLGGVNCVLKPLVECGLVKAHDFRKLGSKVA